MTEKTVLLLFPHQLFEQANLLPVNDLCIVEEFLFFRQYKFHKQKLIFHRASCRAFAHKLQQQSKTVIYIESHAPVSDVRKLPLWLKEKEFTVLHYFDPADDWLECRLQEAAAQAGLQLVRHASPAFLNEPDQCQVFPDQSASYFQTDFYIHQRKQRKILTDQHNKPAGGKWSWDAENRKKYPRNQPPPSIVWPALTPWHTEAIKYVQTHYASNPGEGSTSYYPVTHESARQWLLQFLEQRFYGFGLYEDAMLQTNVLLHHSLLSPLINTGLLLPDQVLQQAIDLAGKERIPLNSLEGFVRQILGWREFVRLIYVREGRKQRCQNFWNFHRPVPDSFYNGTTGIEPVDIVIKRVLQTGYCHHIERLMVLGNFMLLCEFAPHRVYQWFMELFIDAYDWVMVPNVYGMSQFADGGMMTTKPYISGSNYLLKMGDWPKGEWQTVWDGLFWRFMHTQQQFFSTNPRLGMLLATWQKMPEAKRQQHLTSANQFLAQL
jgi:deoxyribodipyrimidine photolyase-related protein